MNNITAICAITISGMFLIGMYVYYTATGMVTGTVTTFLLMFACVGLWGSFIAGVIVLLEQSKSEILESHETQKNSSLEKESK